MDGEMADVGSSAAVPAARNPDDFDAVMNEIDMGQFNQITGRTPEQPMRVPSNDPGINPDPKESGLDAAPKESQLAKDDDTHTRAEVLNADEQKQFEAWKARRNSPILDLEADGEKLVSVPWREGEEREVTVNEMKQGYMRHLDYSRKTQDIGQREQRVQQSEQNMNQFLTELQNPQSMRERLEDLGYGETLWQVARSMYGEVLKEERYLHQLKQRGANDEELNFWRQNFDQQRQQATRMRMQDRQLQQANARAQQAQTRTNEEAANVQLQNQLAQLRPAAFRSLGMPVGDPQYEEVFLDQFVAHARMNQANGGKQQLRDVVMSAAQATKQFVEDKIAAYRAIPKPAAPSDAPLPVSRAAGVPPGSNGVEPARQKRMGLEDFDKEMERLNGWR